MPCLDVSDSKFEEERKQPADFTRQISQLNPKQKLETVQNICTNIVALFHANPMAIQPLMTKLAVIPILEMLEAEDLHQEILVVVLKCVLDVCTLCIRPASSIVTHSFLFLAVVS